MKRKHAKKISAIIAGVILAVFYVLSFISVQSTSTAYAQGQPATGEAEKFKTLLLRPGGWEGDWKMPGAFGDFAIVFEIRGEKVVANITTTPMGAKKTQCERDTIISSDFVKFDGCLTTGITLQFDPNDPVWQLKGKSPNGAEYKLKAK